MTGPAAAQAPSIRISVRKYVAVAETSLRQSLMERGAIVGRVAFYAVILFIFSRLWAVVIEHGAIEGASATDLLWYLALTEWVILSVPLVHLDIEKDVRTGDISYCLTRPMSYAASKLFESGGEMLLRLLVLGLAGSGFAYLLAGGFPDDPRGLAVALPLGIAAAWLAMTFHAVIGLTAFWLQDCSPVYWMWQKAAFVLGGLMLPLDIYPDWLRGIAMWTPFSAIMYGPGRMAFGFDPELALLTTGKLLFWGAVATSLFAFTYRRALRVLDVNGG